MATHSFGGGVSKDRIVLAPSPRGVFGEGVLTGAAAYPGQLVVITPGQTARNSDGRFNVEPAGFSAAGAGLVDAMTADGDKILVRVLIEDALQGRVVGTQYAVGEHVRFYTPAIGEELNVMFQNQSGTADDLGIGTELIVDDGTGKVFKTTGSPQSKPFECLEVVTDPAADVLVTVAFRGN